jgi:hypothetical protein
MKIILPFFLSIHIFRIAPLVRLEWYKKYVTAEKGKTTGQPIAY